MTRYARTKDGVYQILRETQISEYTIRYDVKPNKKLEYHIFNENIIKESNNLEDLFDAYVTYDINNEYDFFTGKNWDDTYPFEEDLKKLKDNTLWVMNNHPELKQVLYAAIWTNKGLIYVARMNTDGEWELI